MNNNYRKLRFVFASLIVFAVVFIVIFFSGLLVVPAHAAGGRHIKDDASGGDCVLIGNWNAGTKTCVLTSDLLETTHIDSDYITLEGNGHRVTVPAGSMGIYVPERTGVTIKNLNIQQPTLFGIVLYKSHGSLVADNTIDSVPIGIYVGGGQNSIENNTIQYGMFGIALEHTGHNIIQNNFVKNGTYGIVFFYVGNSFGFLLDPFVGSPNNQILNNTIQDNLSDIEMGGFTDPALCNNSMSGNIGSGGLPIGYFSASTILTGGEYAELIFCNADNSDIRNVTTTSTFYNNRLVIMLTDNSTFTNITASGNSYAGAGIQVNYSNFNIFKNIIASNNNYGGIAFSASTNNEIDGATFDANGNGISFNSSSHNVVRHSTISNSFAITEYSIGGNQIYNNNFINTSPSGPVSELENEPTNIFNLAKPIGGNYWSNYSTPIQGCADADNDGFCDTPYSFTRGQDNLPWTKKDGWIVPPNTPPALSDLGQWDGSVRIAEGAIVRHPSIGFSGNVATHISSPDGALQVELRGFEEPFTGNDDGGILTSDLVSAGGVVRVARIGLSDGNYHWRARAIDSNGNKSEWQEFGNSGNIDFVILTNQSPVASFTFTPQNSKVGDEIFFDASRSSDPDGTIVLYGWDWESDGVMDAYTVTPFMHYDGFLEGTFTTTLYVTDNKGGVGSVSAVVSVVPTHQSIASASILDAFCAAFGGWFCASTTSQDEKDIKTIDEWLRDENGDGVADESITPFAWLKGTKCGGAGTSLKQKECLISALNTEFVSESGLTYKAYILSMITEQKMVERAFVQQHINTYELYMNILVDWLPFKNVIDIFYNDITTSGMKGFLMAAAPRLPYATADVFTYGTSFLSLGMNAIKLNATFNKLDDGLYHEALVAYILMRSTGHDHESSWKSCIENGRCGGPGIILVGTLSEDMLSETKDKFDEWYNKYQPHFEGAFGFKNQFKQGLKNDAEALILFAIKNK